MNRIIIILALAGLLTACNGGEGSGGGGGPLPNITPTPDPAAPEDPTPTPPAPNTVLSYDGATRTVAVFGWEGFSVSNQLSPSSPILDCQATGANAGLFASFGIYLNQTTCEISSTSREGILPSTTFSITATTENGTETAEVSLQAVPRTWLAEYSFTYVGPSVPLPWNPGQWGVTTKWKELKDFWGATNWTGATPISQIAIKEDVLFVFFSDATYKTYTIDGFGLLPISGVALPGSYDLGPTSTVQYQTRDRFLYQCSGNSIQQLVPHGSTPNQYVALASPIIQTSAPIHLEDANGFLIAYNADGSVFKYSVDQVWGSLTFSAELTPTSPPTPTSCSTFIP